jgi:predicted HTH transcriptional regulator
MSIKNLIGNKESQILEFKSRVSNSVIVTLYSADMGKLMEKELGIGLNERQKNCLEYLREHGRITRKEYENINGVSKRTSTRDLNDLMKKKIIKKVGKDPSLYYILEKEVK